MQNETQPTSHGVLKDRGRSFVDCNVLWYGVHENRRQGEAGNNPRECSVGCHKPGRQTHRTLVEVVFTAAGSKVLRLLPLIWHRSTGW